MINGTLGRVIVDDAFWVLQWIGVEAKAHGRIKEVFLNNPGSAVYCDVAERLYFNPDFIRYCIKVTPKKDTLPVPPRSVGVGGTSFEVKEGNFDVRTSLHNHVGLLAETAQEFGQNFLFPISRKRLTWDEERQLVEKIREFYSRQLFVHIESNTGIQAVERDFFETGLIGTVPQIMSSPLKFYEMDNPEDDLRSSYNIFERCVLAGQDYKDSLGEAHDLKIPVCLVGMSTMTLECAASPYAAAVQVMAEFLAGLCLVQLLRPGTPVINGGGVVPPNIRYYYSQQFGSIFYNLSNWLITLATSEQLYLSTAQSFGAINGQHNPVSRISESRGGITSESDKELDSICRKYNIPLQYKNLMVFGTDLDTEIAYRLLNSLPHFHMARHAVGQERDLNVFNFNKMRNDLTSLQYVIDNDIKLPKGELEYWVKQYCFYDPLTYEAIEKGAQAGSFNQLDHTRVMMDELKQFYVYSEDMAAMPSEVLEDDVGERINSKFGGNDPRFPNGEPKKAHLQIVAN